MKQRKETPKSSDLPIYLFKQGNNQEAYRYFGAHLCEENGEADAASLETSDAASEDAASLAASEEALFSSATAEEAEVSD